MISRNPYEPPASTAVVEASPAENSGSGAIRRVFKFFLGSGLAAVIGFVAGMFGATLYARHYHPNDPDPVDFTIGAILLWVWVGIWFAGTVLAAWFAFRRSRSNAA